MLKYREGNPTCHKERKMKKSLSVILMILLLLFFVSCEKDKSEEVISTYEKFCKTYMLMTPVTELFPTTQPGDGGKLGDVAISEEHMKSFLSAYTRYEIEDITITDETSLKFKTGIITIEGDATKKTAVIKPDQEAKITVSYKVSGEEEGKEAEKSNEEYKIVMSSSIDIGEKAKSVSFALTLNGNVYGTISYTFEGDKFTSASVDGKKVNVRLLNAAHLNPTPSSAKGDTEITESDSKTEPESKSLFEV